jgi:hypothetical protein
MNPYRDDKGEITSESIFEQYMKDLGSTLAGAAPGGAELYNFIMSKITGDRYYGLEVSTIEMINDLTTDLSSLYDSIKDEDADIDKIKKNAGKVLMDASGIAGIPLENIKKIYDAGKHHALDILNGEPLSFEAGYTRSATVNNERLYEAMVSGDDEKFDDVYAEMLRNGTTPDKIYGGSGSAGLMVKDDLLNGNIDVNTAVDYLEKLGAEDASEKVAEWVKDDTKEKFEAGTIDSEEAEEALMEAGMGANDAHFKVQEWETGSTSDYIGVINAISSGDHKDIVDAVNEMLEYGYDKEKLKSYSGITSNFKEQYIDLYHTNKTEAASLKSAILTYYQACGMSREDAAKKVDKWVE